MSAHKKFSSNGKLLLSGEYLVLKGALALALPLNHRHILEIQPAEGKNTIQWESQDINQTYFSGIFSKTDLRCISSNNKNAEEFISKLLAEARKLNKNFLSDDRSLRVTSRLTFSRIWGWGSSSTSINNIAQWADIDPFKLFFSTQNGSAYDIACAMRDHPILYQLRKKEPVFQDVTLFSPLTDHAFFIFTGRKSDTRSKVNSFLSSDNISIEDIEKISTLTKEICRTRDLKDLSYLIRQHEKIISEILGCNTIKEEQFPDFEGCVKSLGAWGGDFIMALSEKGNAYTRKYFDKKGMHPIFGFNEIVL